ncbi:MAG: hypothetical protein SF066_05865 [Thermoanaerobaculia bacterium]|nr:hypothetical protein [Thermoanaerobaculia bacterium]
MRSRLLVLVAIFAGLLSGSLESWQGVQGCTCGAGRKCSMAARPRTAAKPACHKPAVKAAVPPCHAALGLTAEEPTPPPHTACELVAGCCQRHAKIRAAERPSEAPVEPVWLAGLTVTGPVATMSSPNPLDRAQPPQRRPPRPFPFA